MFTQILEAVRSEEVEEVAAARPTRANPKRAAADDKVCGSIGVPPVGAVARVTEPYS